MQTGPLFKTPRGEEIGKALEFCAGGIAGAEMYTFLLLHRETVPEGRFWCAENAAGEVTDAVFNNGDRTVYLSAGRAPYPGLRLLRPAGELPPPPGNVRPLAADGLMAVYRLLGGEEKLSPANEERYVYRARAVRDGLAESFAVYENGRPVSFAFITAQNRTACLVGDVFTAVPFRGRGYASGAVLAAAARAAALHKTPYILCEAPREGFYTRLGFAPAPENEP